MPKLLAACITKTGLDSEPAAVELEELIGVFQFAENYTNQETKAALVLLRITYLIKAYAQELFL